LAAQPVWFNFINCVLSQIPQLPFVGVGLFDSLLKNKFEKKYKPRQSVEKYQIFACFTTLLFFVSA
jgi:hypothetical protein